MKDSLKPGVSFTNKLPVTKEKTIGFMGDDLRVYATPSMVQDTERTCRDFMLEHLDDGEGGRAWCPSPAARPGWPTPRTGARS